MRIAIGSDMADPLADHVVELVRSAGHQVQLFGAIGEGPRGWSDVGANVGRSVAAGSADQGLVMCWTGTGVSIAANKVDGVRAALCWDAQTAEGARKWNDANVLAMSLRATSREVAREILDAWFASEPSDDPEDLAPLERLAELDTRS